MEEIKIFAPATVANVACGFDVLGFCLDNVGDEMVIRKVRERGIRISRIEGAVLPYAAEQNVAGVSALAMYNSMDLDFGFEIEIYKKIKPGSGIGSSAASAVGSVYGMNALLGKPFTRRELLMFAIKGEALASGCEHADNLAPAMLGGFTLVKSLTPFKVLQIPTPEALYATILHPQIEIKTSESRALLPKEVPLHDAITQWANVGSLVHGLHTSDYALIQSSLHDIIIEPQRSKMIPNYAQVKEAGLKAGALGIGISGSGPSIFALSQGRDIATKVADSFAHEYSKTEIDYDIHVSKINTHGIKIL